MRNNSPTSSASHLIHRHALRTHQRARLRSDAKHHSARVVVVIEKWLHRPPFCLQRHVSTSETYQFKLDLLLETQFFFYYFSWVSQDCLGDPVKWQAGPEGSIDHQGVCSDLLTPTIIPASVQKSAGWRADMFCSAEAIKGIPGILHWALLCNGCSPSSRPINFIKVCRITKAICLSDAIKTIRGKSLCT